jgi:hypothetical protein
MSTPKIFISYSHSDQEWARQLAEALAKSGLDVWFDEFNIKPGQPLAEALEKGLRESDAVILLINSENVNRPNLLFEIGAAVGMNKPMIPVVSRDLEVHRLPALIQRIRFLLRKSPEETARELVTAVEALHGEVA